MSQVREPVPRDAEVQHLGDVRRREHRCRLRLELEAGARVLVRLGEEELHRDALAERDVPRGEHHAHASAPDDGVEHVLLPDDVPGRRLRWERRGHRPQVTWNRGSRPRPGL